VEAVPDNRVALADTLRSTAAFTRVSSIRSVSLVRAGLGISIPPAASCAHCSSSLPAWSGVVYSRARHSPPRRPSPRRTSPLRFSSRRAARGTIRLYRSSTRASIDSRRSYNRRVRRAHRSSSSLRAHSACFLQVRQRATRFAISDGRPVQLLTHGRFVSLCLSRLSEITNTRDAMFPFCVEIGDIDVTNPCDDSSESPSANSTVYQLWKASCTAKEANIILAMNLCETKPCSSATDPACPSDGRYQWNTQVVFDESGTLVLKYHKSHLFGGSAVFDEAMPESASFLSSFGVRFGTFICFDMEYPHPALDLIQAGVTDFLFSSWWVNAVPSANAVMQQQAWSRLHAVNLIASNTGESSANSGGGIYASGQALAAVFNSTSILMNQLLVATVPIQPKKVDDVDDERTRPQPIARHPIELMSTPASQRPHANPLTTLDYQPCQPNQMFAGAANCTVLNAAQLSEVAIAEGRLTDDMTFSIPISYGGVSCLVEVSFNQINSTDQYMAFAYEGVQTFPDTPDPLSLQICALHHCLPTPSVGRASSLLTCQGSWDAFESTIDAFSITATGFESDTSAFPMLAVDDGQIIVDVEQTTYTDHNPGPNSVRVVQWSSTANFSDQSLSSAMVYGIRPNKDQRRQ
jgi:hypothetical protein